MTNKISSKFRIYFKAQETGYEVDTSKGLKINLFISVGSKFVKTKISNLKTLVFNYQAGNLKDNTENKMKIQYLIKRYPELLA